MDSILPSGQICGGDNVVTGVRDILLEGSGDTACGSRSLLFANTIGGSVRIVRFESDIILAGVVHGLLRPATTAATRGIGSASGAGTRGLDAVNKLLLCEVHVGGGACEEALFDEVARFKSSCCCECPAGTTLREFKEEGI